jgi:hypothetical protein
MGGQIRLRFRHRDLASEWMDWLFASPAELRELTDGSAWKVSDVFVDGAQYAAELALRA